MFPPKKYKVLLWGYEVCPIKAENKDATEARHALSLLYFYRTLEPPN
ncbi:hypothetical protein MTBBW1_2180005 [Desulfamplus magnetovallimortis]|uniref:Uncharacterized protein n=1 Tax=Desulfamplus magnetovallimortis TaxID=1246637 RepID=A0A1W1HCQ1_9BACT|nr:hypothetical protein MTBBW1_2180005 [Desulfamplus magnetovallimortis]